MLSSAVTKGLIGISLERADVTSIVLSIPKKPEGDEKRNCRNKHTNEWYYCNEEEYKQYKKTEEEYLK